MRCLQSGEGRDKYGRNSAGAGVIYKGLFQAVILYGRKSWVVMGCVLKNLEGLHNPEARRILVKTARRMTGGEWKFSLLYYALDTTEIWRIKEYIQRRQATIVEQVACWTIYELCMGV